MHYVYENWRAGDKTKVHRADCKKCNCGKGTGTGTRGTENGKWHGPFKTCDEAKKYALSLGRRENRCCNTCKPEQTRQFYNTY